MAKAGGRAETMDQGGAATNSDGREGSVASFFRRFYRENPHLLKLSSNEQALEAWLAANPGHSEVPDNIKASLTNTKSQMRKKRGKRGRPRKEDAVVGELAGVKVAAPRRHVGRPGLEALEEHIDDCLSNAKNLDRDGLAEVILHLREARNAVVMMGGQ